MESELSFRHGDASRLPHLSRRRLLFLAVVYEGGLFLVGWLLARLLGLGQAPGLGLTAASVLWGILLGLALLAAVYLSLRSNWRPILRFRAEVEEVVGRLFADCTVLDLAFISSLAGIAEEFVFRGWIQTGLSGSIGTWAAVGLAAFLFGAAHAISLTYAVYATIIGFALGAALVVSGALWVPILAHAVYDFGALTWLIHWHEKEGDGNGADPVPRDLIGA